MTKPKILITTSHYLPGYKSGGPLRSILNLVNNLHDDFDFMILTSDRDLADSAPYTSIRYGEWSEVHNAKVRYLSPEEQTFKGVCDSIAKVEHDLLYLNSFFASWSTIWPLLGRRIGRVPKQPLLLAPRGEFSAGALALKSLKKNIYINIAKLTICFILSIERQAFTNLGAGGFDGWVFQGFLSFMEIFYVN